MKNLNQETLARIRAQAALRRREFESGKEKRQAINLPAVNNDEYSEILSERKEYLKVYQANDGRKKMVLSDVPMHVYDETTRGYSDIDNQLTNEGDSFVNGKAGYKARFNKNAQGGKLFEMEKDGYKVSLEIPNYSIYTCRRTDNPSEVLYENVFPETDISYEAKANKVKENIIVKARRDSYSYRFVLKTEGLNAELEQNGKTISLKDASRKEIFRIPAPFMYDSAKQISRAVSYALSGEILTVIADSEWVNAPERVFPVTIDPTIQVSSGHYVELANFDPDGNWYYDNLILMNYRGYYISIYGSVNLNGLMSSQGLSINDVSRCDFIFYGEPNSNMFYGLYGANGTEILWDSPNWDGTYTIPLKTIYNMTGSADFIIAPDEYCYDYIQDPNGTIVIEYGNATLSSISIATPPSKTIYSAGEYFNTSGMVVRANYSDGTSKIITGYIYSPNGVLTAGISFITISYTENGITKTAMQNLAVQQKQTESICAQDIMTFGSLDCNSGDIDYTNHYVLFSNMWSQHNEAVCTINYSTLCASMGTSRDLIEKCDLNLFLYGGYNINIDNIYIKDTNGNILCTTSGDESALIIPLHKIIPTSADEFTFHITTNSGSCYVYSAGSVIEVEYIEFELNNIAITRSSSKTIYSEGEYFNRNGMIVTAYYNNEFSRPITNYTSSPTRALSTADTYITISYNGKTAMQSITVNAATPILTGISITTPPSKTVYIAGESFNTSGMIVKANYSDGTSKTVINYSYSPSGTLTAGTFSITLSYTENGVTRTATQSITVNTIAIKNENNGNYYNEPITNYNFAGGDLSLNLNSGHYRFEFTDLITGENQWALNFSHILSSNILSNKTNFSPYGKGWKLNLEQYLIYIGDIGLKEYRYIDGAGNTHMVLEDSYAGRDTTGLNLIMTTENNQRVLTDKLGNKMFFNMDGHIVRNESVDGQIITYTYTNSLLSYVYVSISSHSPRTFSLTYDNSNLLTKIKCHQTGIEIYYEYDSGYLKRAYKKLNNISEDIISFINPSAPTYAQHLSGEVLQFPTIGNELFYVSTGYLNASGEFYANKSDLIQLLPTSLQTIIYNNRNLQFVYSYGTNGKIYSVVEQTPNNYTISDKGLVTGNYDSPQIKNFTSVFPKIEGRNIALINTISDSQTVSAFNDYKIYDNTAININQYAFSKMKYLKKSLYFSAWVNVYGAPAPVYPSPIIPDIFLKVTYNDEFDSPLSSERTFTITVDRGKKNCWQLISKQFDITGEIKNFSVTSNSSSCMYVSDVRISDCNDPIPCLGDSNLYLAGVNKIMLTSITDLPIEISVNDVSDKDILATMRSQYMNPSNFEFTYYNGKLVRHNIKKVEFRYAFSTLELTNGCLRYLSKLSDGGYIETINTIKTYNGKYVTEVKSIHKNKNRNPTGYEETTLYYLNGRIAKKTDSNGMNTVYTYNTYGNLEKTELTAKNGKKMVYNNTYTSNGEHLKTSGDARGKNTEFSYYDPQSVLQNYKDAEGQTFTNNYNTFKHNQTGVTSDLNSVNYTNTFGYDTKGRLETLGGFSCPEYSFGYDNFNRINKFKAAGNLIWEKIYSKDTSNKHYETITYSNDNIARTKYYDNYDRLIEYKEGNTTKATQTYRNHTFQRATTSAAKLREITDTSNIYTDTTRYSYNDLDELSGYYLLRKPDVNSETKSILQIQENLATEENTREHKYIINNEQEFKSTILYDDNPFAPRVQQIRTVQNDSSYSSLCMQSENFYENNGFGRVECKKTEVITKKYSYLTNADNTSTPYVSQTDFYYGESNNSFESIGYGYDNNGNVIKIKNKNQTYGNEFTYDKFNRIKTEKIEQVEKKSYNYNSYGLRENKTDNGVLTSYGYDSNKRLSQITKSGTSWYFGYDSCGTPLHYKSTDSSKSTGTRNMFWNGGLLQRYNNTNFEYNAFGRRTKKKTGNLEKTYYFDGDRILGEDWYNSSTNKTLQIRFFYDEEGVVKMTTKTKGSIVAASVYHFVRDALGNIIKITDFGGYIVKVKFSYDAFGNFTITDDYSSGFNISSESSAQYKLSELNPFLFKSHYYDHETGFYYIGGNYYDPDTGRFVNMGGIEELISNMDSIKGLDLYSFCGHNPLSCFINNSTVFTALELSPFIGSIISPPTFWDKISSWYASISPLNKIITGVVVVSVLAALSLITSGGVSCLFATMCVSALKGAAIGAATGLVIGGITGFISGGFEGMLQGAVYGAADGFMIGAITGAIEGAIRFATNPMCFIAGTLVLAEDGHKKIEDVKKGDLVWAYDEETGESDWKPVVRLFRNKASTKTQLTIKAEDGTIDEITSTPGHKYYLPDNKRNRNADERLEHTSYEGLSDKWVSACDLKKGDRVLLANADSLTGKPKFGIVIGVKTEECEEFTTYNFEVADFHTYYVGENGVCVHNAACDWKWGEGGRGSVDNNIKTHFRDHGADMGFNSVDDYVKASQNFAEQVSKARVKGVPWDGFTDGIARYTYNGKVIGMDKFTKTIVSFYPKL